MTITTPLRPAIGQNPRSAASDVSAIPRAVKSEWIKLASLRASKAILATTIAANALGAWAVATLVTDEVLTVSEVFVFPALFTAVLAAVAGVLLFTSEAQHGTLAATLTAQPARWVIAASKMAVTTTTGLLLGVAGMLAGFVGAVLGQLALGDTSTMAATTLWTLLYISFAGVLGLGVGMIVRHSSGATSGLLVWWFVGENLLRTFLPAKLVHFLPFDAGYRILEVGNDFDPPEVIATALSRPQYGLIFGGYAAVALVVGTVLLQRRDTN